MYWQHSKRSHVGWQTIKLRCGLFHRKDSIITLVNVASSHSISSTWLACRTLFRCICPIQTSPTDCSGDSWRNSFFGKYEHVALWLLICGAFEKKHLLSYLLMVLIFTRFIYWMQNSTWAPAGMGKRGHLPSPPLSPLKCCKVFCALVVTAKRSADELFMHYFHNLSSASGALPPDSHWGLHSWTPLGDFCLQIPNAPTPGKNPAGAHGTAPRCYHQYK